MTLGMDDPTTQYVRSLGLSILGLGVAGLTFVIPALGYTIPHPLLIGTGTISSICIFIGLYSAVFGVRVCNCKAHFVVTPALPLSDLLRLIAPVLVSAVIGWQSIRLGRLEVKLQPRHLTKHQIAILVDVLSKRPGSFDLMWAPSGEAGAYAAQLEDVFLKAHWNLNFRSTMTEQYAPQSQPQGLLLGVHDINNAPASAVVVADAFKKAGIEFGVANNSSVVPNNPFLIVGDKP